MSNIVLQFTLLGKYIYTVKINTGDEPISNTIWGLDGTYQKTSPFITISSSEVNLSTNSNLPSSIPNSAAC